MLKKDKYNVMIARFPYGRMEDMDIGDWLAGAVVTLKEHPRVSDDIQRFRINDTPITMGRNRAVEVAQASDVDFLIMVDSDMKLDAYAPENPYRLEMDPTAKPFLPSSLDFAIKQREAGEPCVVGAPYCGPPPWENVYVFKWSNKESHSPNVDWTLEQYTREETVELSGIRECAALPTGLVIIDMAGVEKIVPPYFYYEWDDENEAGKASTEDVTFTRDLAIRGVPQFCNWSAWAGHWKLKCVGRPVPVTSRIIGENYRKAVLRDVNIAGPGEQMVMANGKARDNSNGSLPKKQDHAPPERLEGHAENSRMQFAEPEVTFDRILDALCTLHDDVKILHLNCADGKRTREMLEHDERSTIICTDDWSDAVYRVFEETTSGFLGSRVVPIRMKVKAQSSLRSPEDCEMVVFENPSQQDIEGFLKHMGHDGVMVGFGGDPSNVFPDSVIHATPELWYVLAAELAEMPGIQVTRRIGDQILTSESRYSDLDLKQFSAMIAERKAKQPDRQIIVVHAGVHDAEIAAVARAELGDRGQFFEGGGPMADVLFISSTDPAEVYLATHSAGLCPNAIVCGWGANHPNHTSLTDYLAENEDVQYPGGTNLWWYRHADKGESKATPKKIGVKRG